MSDQPDDHLATLPLAVQIVCAYVANNHVQTAELPAVIAGVHAALTGIANPVATPVADPVEKPTPAQIRKSITDDALISFIDGKPYKSIKRHLTKHGLDPRGYRERFGLPANYPMVAASYAAQRSMLAKRTGLGGPRRVPADPQTARAAA